MLDISGYDSLCAVGIFDLVYSRCLIFKFLVHREEVYHLIKNVLGKLIYIFICILYLRHLKVI